MVRNTIKLCIRFFLHKIKKQRKTGEMFSTFAGMTSLTSNWKLFNFINLRKLTKTPKNFVQGSYSWILTKIWHKDRVEVLTSGSFLGRRSLSIKKSHKVLKGSQISQTLFFKNCYDEIEFPVWKLKGLVIKAIRKC